MSYDGVDRRNFLKRAALTALAASASLMTAESGAQQPVPHSSGTEPPKLKAPAGTRSTLEILLASILCDTTAER